MHPEDPVRLGNYTVVRRLRDVPVGTTLLGTDQTGRAIVLTLVDAGLAARDGFRERFAREARAAASAPPAFVAAVLDVDVNADPPWLATVAVPGPSLAEFVHERGPLGDAGTAALGRRLVDGLAALHAVGLVHGDLTPDAVVLAEEGPRLVGFGLSRVAGPGHGTPGFEAPEQITGSDGDPTPDPAVDVFALGCVLGYAANGRSPFAAVDPAAIRWRAGQDEPDLGALTEPVRSTVLACLHGEPAQRPSAAQVAARLAAELGPDAAPTVAAGSPTATLVGAPPVGSDGGSYGEPPAQAAARAGGLQQYGPQQSGPQQYGPRQGASPFGPPQPEPQRYGSPSYGAAGASSASARRRGPLIAAVALAVVVVLALVAGVALLVTRGTGQDAARPTAAAGPSSGSPAVPPGGSTAGSTAASSAAPTTANVDPGTGATLVDPGAFGVDSPRFTTPSRNISCRLSDAGAGSDGQARCDVAQRTWQLPATPADCPGVFGTGAQVSGADKGTLTCVSDTVADPGLQVLQYGQALSFGGTVCDSEETGVRCTNRTSGHGFRVARASYDLF